MRLCLSVQCIYKMTMQDGHKSPTVLLGKILSEAP